MQIANRSYGLLIFCSVIDFHKSFSGQILGFLYMDCVSWFQFLSRTCDYGAGFLLFGCFKQLFNLACIMLFINLTIKILQFRSHFKGLPGILHGFSEKSGNFMINGPSFLENLRKSEPKSKKLNRGSNGRANDESDGLSDGDIHNVDEVFDVMTLRNLVKRETKRANDAYVELDKERVASASASTEAMAMIRRLQKEKSLIEMELNQYRRLAEEKQSHDQDVIQSLKWLVKKHESERGNVDEQLSFHKRKLKILPKGDDVDCEENDEIISFSNSSIGEGSPCHELISSLDYHSTP